jgi:hypothetical protein
MDGLTVRRAVELLHTARQAGRRAAVAVAVAVAAVLQRRYWPLGTEGSTGGAGQELDWIFSSGALRYWNGGPEPGSHEEFSSLSKTSTTCENMCRLQAFKYA